MMYLLYFLPTVLISRLVGVLVFLKLPSWIVQPVIQRFVSYYQISIDESEYPPSNYPSLGDFFIRRLKPGVRKIEEGVVSPCDGTLSQFGEIRDGLLFQIKGRSYLLSDLLAESDLEDYEGGYYLTIYLAPRDYHRVHSPVSANFTSVRDLPGRLLPVSQASTRIFNNLFPGNIRKDIQLTLTHSKIRLIMVGALNVGSIELLVDSGRIEKGDELGVFRLGSTVVLIFPKNVFLQKQLQEGMSLKMGQTIGSLIE